MYLVSTGKSTVLTEFANLETRSTYRHVNSESTDFQFYKKHQTFVEVNKKSGLEVLRIKEKSNKKMEIQRVRKLNIENVYCVACAKQTEQEMALGLSNGQVKLYNYKNSEFVHKFNAENIRNSVLYIDYNMSDEYMSSVFENGQINIFGIKTRAKIDTVNIDGNSTLARFHPTKRFHLAIASYKGTVTIYDVQTKRNLFHSVDAHAAPCRDLCMAPATDMLVSVGYDCLINIFDTRRKTQPVQLRNGHPLSTVALSDCGTYCCVGNLKGELIAYDMRNTKALLATKKVHECAVTRIAFLPMRSEAANSFSSTGNLTTDVTAGAIDSSNVERPLGGGDARKSLVAKLGTGAETTARCHRDSFCDFLDFQANKGSEKIPARYVSRRDSYDCWDALQRKPSIEEQRVSFCPLGVSGMSSVLNSANNSSVTAPGDSFDGKLNTYKKNMEEAGGVTLLVPPTMPLRERSTNSLNPGNKLVKIQEEQSLQNASSGSDKENPAMDMEQLSRLHKLPADRNSTPNRPERRSDPIVKVAVAPTEKLVTPNSDIAQLRAEMNTRFQQLESEMRFQLETNKWQIFTQNFNLWSKQNENNEAICDALGILLQTDPFVNEFLRLKQENEELKLQLQGNKKK